MTANDILIDGFARVKQGVHEVVHGLGSAQLAQRPGPEANSIAWLVWHLARIQDDHIAGLMDSEQLWTGGSWAEQFNLPFDTTVTGFGQTSEEVGMVQATAELLTGYYDAVHEATVSYIGGLKPREYDDIVDDTWDPPVSRGVRLVSVLNDDTMHLGQAAYVRGLLGE